MRLLYRLLWVLCACTSITACPQSREDAAGGTEEPETSPNASILPAPLRLPRLDAAPELPDATDRPPPEPLREDKPVKTDPLEEESRPGLTLLARFRWVGLPKPPTAPEVAGPALAQARELLQRTLTVDLVDERMRIELTGEVFPLASGSELRARADQLGHIVVWPDRRSYRVLQPGTLRTVLQEGRADVSPLVTADLESDHPGMLLGFDTIISELRTSVGTLVLEQGLIPLPPSGGELLCWTLTELVSARSPAPPCSPDLVPLRATYRWPNGSGLVFETMSVIRSATLDLDRLRVPPLTPSFKADRLPRAPQGRLGKIDLAKFRKRAVAQEPDPELDVPPNGLRADNHGDTIRYLLIDGVPVLRLRPGGGQILEDPKPGKYMVWWTDFLGTTNDPPETVAIPGTTACGTPTPDTQAP